MIDEAGGKTNAVYTYQPAYVEDEIANQPSYVRAFTESLLFAFYQVGFLSLVVAVGVGAARTGSIEDLSERISLQLEGVAQASPRTATGIQQFARDAFVASTSPVRRRARELIESSPPSVGEHNGTPDDPPPKGDELDFVLVRLARRIGDEPVTATDQERRGWIDASSTVSPHLEMPLLILQHPRAAPLNLAMDTRAVLRCSSERIRHTVNTEPGSSGSPCFDFDWNLVAVHHYGDPGYGHPRYNQGVPIAAIRALLTKRNKQQALGESPWPET